MGFQGLLPAGRAICSTLLKVLVGIPENPETQRNSKVPEQEKEREKPAKWRLPRHATHDGFSAVSLCPCSCAVRPRCAGACITELERPSDAWNRSPARGGVPAPAGGEVAL